MKIKFFNFFQKMTNFSPTTTLIDANGGLRQFFLFEKQKKKKKEKMLLSYKNFKEE